jgi:hypothetical protein
MRSSLVASSRRGDDAENAYRLFAASLLKALTQALVRALLRLVQFEVRIPSARPPSDGRTRVARSRFVALLFSYTRGFSETAPKTS